MTEIAIALVLVVLAIGISVGRGLKLEKDLSIATVRALVQLGLVAAAIHLIFSYAGLMVLFVIVMLAAATYTSARRMAGIPRAPLLALASIGTASAVAALILFGAGAFPFEPQFLIPIVGMLIGNCMTATSLAGTRLRDDVIARELEIEARLALGVTSREALRSHVRRAAATSMLPTIDSTKNVGIIFLPGAFVGMMLAGRSPADAAQVQLVVLFMLLGAVAVAGMIVTLLVGRAFIGPGERLVIPPAAADL